ncbi:GNAT family N-acetyltransferase [Pseudomonas fluorescens]|uniref:GNAT family N-acetyltransferase n=1 Tax=Pseudomonas fluorescens TaxID=294 RepID=UPI001BE799D0|nr:GNAT family N-acetyltransferase [Pseudomonas fluorescens]MBT2373117.1 N-acetyltransferase [Pseudomonas fluorescens]
MSGEDLVCSEPWPSGLRPATDFDLPVMLAIFNETAETGANSPVITPATLEQMRFYINFYKKDGMPVYVLELGGEVVGWLSVNRFSWGTQATGLTGEISVYVRAENVGRGIGASLCQAAVDLARDHGMETVVAWIMRENVVSQKMVQSRGFTLWARLPNIARFAERRTDVMLFGRSLD